MLCLKIWSTHTNQTGLTLNFTNALLLYYCLYYYCITYHSFHLIFVHQQQLCFFPFFLLGRGGMWKCTDSFKDTKHYYCTAVSWLTLYASQGEDPGFKFPCGEGLSVWFVCSPHVSLYGFPPSAPASPTIIKKTNVVD